MSEAVDSFLRDELAALAAGRGEADWGDVVARARRGRRVRMVGAAVLVVFVTAGGASALGFGPRTIDFLRSGRAPERVVADFASDNTGAPTKGMNPEAIPGQARRVAELTLDGKRHVLYVAPTKEGGFCFTWTGLGGGCDKTRSDVARIGVNGSEHVPRGSKVPVEDPALWGTFFARGGARLTVHYEDGGQDEIPFVWVTAPIDAGFYLYRIPDGHLTAGRQPETVTLADSRGRTIASGRRVEPSPLMIEWAIDVTHHRVPGVAVLTVPSRAIYAKRRLLFEAPIGPHRHVGLWVAPERGGGSCYWWNRYDWCTSYRRAEARRPKPGKPSRILLVGLAPASIGNSTVLLGPVNPEISRIELRYQDGATAVLRPVGRFGDEPLYATVLPAAHDAPGHRLDALVAYSASGKVLARQTVRDGASANPTYVPQRGKA